MDIKEINIILEYLNLPKNAYYASFLEKKLSKEGKLALKEQEKAIKFIDLAKDINFDIENISISETLSPKLEKISAKKKFSINFDKILTVIKEIWVVPLFVITLFGNLSIFNKIKDKIQIIKKLNTFKVYEFNKKDNNYDYLLTDYKLNLNKNALYFNNKEDFSFDYKNKKYKDIFESAEISKNYLDLLENIGRQKMNYKKLKNVINQALLEQHKVNIINKDKKNGGK